MDGLTDTQRAIKERIAAARRLKDEQESASSPDTPQAPTAASAATAQLIFCGSVQLVRLEKPSRAKRQLRDLALGAADSSRVIDKGRYQDNDLEGILREAYAQEPVRWVSEKHELDMRPQGRGVNQRGPIYDVDQLEMLYYITPTLNNVSGDFAVFNTRKLDWPEGSSNTSYSPSALATPIGLPVGVKPDDAYLGACWMASNLDLHQFFPADIHHDGEPFPDRLSVGTPYMPRAHMKDFPVVDANNPAGEDMTYDRRIGVIICNDGTPVFLGGQGFKVEDIKVVHWANFHHKFIDISSRSEQSLKPVTHEPAEISRRIANLPKPSTDTGGAPSAFDKVHSLLMQLADDRHWGVLADAFQPSAAGASDRQTILDHVPTRGYNYQANTSELPSHALTTGNAFVGAVVAYQRHSEGAAVDRVHIVQLVDKFINGLKAETRANLVRQALELRHRILSHFARTDSLEIEVTRSLRDLPSPGSLLAKAVPSRLLPAHHIQVAGVIGSQIANTTPDTNPVNRYPPRDNAEELIDTSVVVKLPQLAPYASPLLRQNDDPATIEVLQQIPVHEKPAKTRKRQADADNDTSSKRRRGHPNGMIWKYDDPGPAAIRPANDPRGKNRQDCIRKDFARWGLPGRAFKKLDDLVADIEAYVNENQLGLTEMGKNTGYMVKE